MEGSGNFCPFHSAKPNFYKGEADTHRVCQWPGIDLPGGTGCALLFEEHHVEDKGTEGGYTMCQDTALGSTPQSVGF